MPSNACKDRPTLSVRKRGDPSIVLTSYSSYSSSIPTVARPLVLAQAFLVNDDITPKAPSLSSDRHLLTIAERTARSQVPWDKNVTKMSTQWTLQVPKLSDEHRADIQIKFDLGLENSAHHQHDGRRRPVPLSHVGHSALAIPINGYAQKAVVKYVRVPRTPGVKTSQHDIFRDAAPESIMDLTADLFSATGDQVRISCCQPCQERELRKYIREGREDRLINHLQTTSPSTEEMAAHVSPIDFACHELVPIMKNFDKEEVPVEPWFEHQLGHKVSKSKQDIGKLEYSVSLALRITCYSSHHQAENGFKIRFTLKDCHGQIVGTTESNPIKIIENHKTRQRRVLREQLCLDCNTSNINVTHKRKRARKYKHNTIQSKTGPLKPSASLQARPIPHTLGTDIMEHFLGVNIQGSVGHSSP